VFVTGTNQSTQTTSPSLINTTSNSYSSFNYITQCANTDKYNVFYIPWNDVTYIHIVNQTVGSQVSSHYLSSKDNVTYDYIHNLPNISINSYVEDNDGNNNNMVTETAYSNNQVYQLTKNIKFDIKNANLIINTMNGTKKDIAVFDRNGRQPTTLGTSIPTLGTFQPYIQNDNLGQNFVVYLPRDDNTVIAVIGFDSNKKLVLKNVRRFNATGLDAGPVQSSCSAPATSQQPTDNSVSDYYKWYWYWKNSGQADNKYSNDYILKTQVVPPVCPSCPACPAAKSGVCTNCGGNGGSGIVSSNGKGVINNTVDNVGDVISDVAHDAAGLAGGIAKDVTGLAGGLAKDVTGLAGSVVHDVASLGKTNSTVVSKDGKLSSDTNNKVVINRTEGAYKSQYGPSYANGTQNMDQYSYYGSLPTKGDYNFMPVTADFSKFGR
jgi:hypothetical protein